MLERDANKHTQTFEELITELTESEEVPRCFTMNKIGILLSRGDKKAEDFFLKILQTSENKEDLFYAYIYLSDEESDISEETREAIKAFEKDPKNKEVMNHVIAVKTK